MDLSPKALSSPGSLAFAYPGRAFPDHTTDSPRTPPGRDSVGEPSYLGEDHETDRLVFQNPSDPVIGQRVCCRKACSLALRVIASLAAFVALSAITHECAPKWPTLAKLGVAVAVEGFLVGLCCVVAKKCFSNSSPSSKKKPLNPPL